MDPATMAAAALRIINAVRKVKAIADEVQENKEQAQRVKVYMDAFLKVQSKIREPQVEPEVLTLVEGAVDYAMEVLTSFAPDHDEKTSLFERGKRLVGRLRHREDDRREFERVFFQCGQALQMLDASQQLGADARMEQDREAAQRDQAEKQRILEDMQRTMETQRQLQALQLDAHGQKLDGMADAIQAVLKLVAAPPAPPPAQVPTPRDKARAIKLAELEVASDAAPLGSGAFAVVRHGRWAGADVAVKQLNQGHGVDPTPVFEREVRVLGMAAHPNVLRLLGVVREGGRLWMVTPLAPGGSLEAMVRRDGALEPTQCYRVALGVVAGVAHLHAHLNVTHRDLKPANILLDVGGAPLVADFGLSRVRESSTGGASSVQPGAGGGTLRYAPPDPRPGFAGDVYSLGMVLYEMVSGQRPFARMGDFQIYEAVKSGRRPDLRGVSGAEWRALLQSMWAAEPATRATLEEVEGKLQAMREGLEARLAGYRGGGGDPLQRAAGAGDEEAVRALAAAGADVDHLDGDGWTALAKAAAGGHVGVARALLGLGAAVDLQNDDGYSALSVACHEGHVEVARELLGAGAAVDLQKNDGASPLFMACQNGHVEVARVLLGAGAAVDRQMNDGASPLFVACQEGHVEVVRVLLGAGAAVDLQRSTGASPLFIACQNGHVEVARELLGAGAAVDLQDDDGYSALFIACQNGHVEVARELLGAGAAVDLQDNDGASPLFFACQNGHVEVARELLGAGAAVDLQDNDGASPLFIACQNGHVEVARVLLGAGAAVDLQMNTGASPLFMACQEGHVEVARVLLGAGAAVDLQRSDGASPLWIACVKGHVEVARELLRAGAAVSRLDVEVRGRDALGWAVHLGHQEGVRLIRELRPGS